MKIKYLKKATNQINLKKLYRELSFKMHPDKGGDLEEMKILNNEYDYLKIKLPKLGSKINRNSFSGSTDYVPAYNFVTGRMYTMGNASLLAAFGGGPWMTFNQGRKLGYKMKKGSKGVCINFFKEEINDEGKKEFVVRRFTVFKLECFEAPKKRIG